MALISTTDVPKGTPGAQAVVRKQCCRQQGTLFWKAFSRSSRGRWFEVPNVDSTITMLGGTIGMSAAGMWRSGMRL